MRLNNKEYVLETLRGVGLTMATNLQIEADTMTGTELYDRENYIPDFAEAIKKKNMLERDVGFTCLSSAGRVVRLLQKYDSTIYTAEPEELPSLWGFKWSTNPDHALPFVAISTSPYMKDEVCSENEVVYRSKIDNNVWSPTEYPQGWEVAE